MILNLTSIIVQRKELNENEKYKTSEKIDNSIQAVSPDDEAILELLSEIIKSDNTNNE